jgi:hypothetical protein
VRRRDPDRRAGSPTSPELVREVQRALVDRFARRLTTVEKRRVARFLRASRRDPAHVLGLSATERGKLLGALRHGLGL